MKKLASIATLSLVTAFAGSAAADESDGGTGPRFGLRTGYMIPIGDASKDNKLGDTVGGGIPIWLDAGYRVIPSVYVGLYFDYAILFPADKICPSGTDCSFHQIRVGVMGAYHFIPAGPIDPWAGLGIGYEIVGGSVGPGDFSTKGLEFLNLQGGADYKVTPNIRVGPFLSFSLGQYSTTTSGNQSGDIKDTAMHEWFTIGVRGAYDLNL